MITRKTMLALLSATPVSLLTSCGTILYPDRAHQNSRGRIDPAVAIMDGVGCLLFLIPGLIAFAVDFHTGAIYFPAGKGPGDNERTIFDSAGMYKHPDQKLTQRDIEQVVSKRAGTTIHLSRLDVHCFKVSGIEHANKMVAQINA